MFNNSETALLIQVAFVQVTIALMGQGHIGVALKLSATMIRRGYLLESIRLLASLVAEAFKKANHKTSGESAQLYKFTIAAVIAYNAP